MAKTSENVNPKLTFARKVLAKARPILLRNLGVLGRVQVNPAAAEAELVKFKAEMVAYLTGALGASGLPVCDWDAPLPTDGWIYAPLIGERNAKHANTNCGVMVACMKEGAVAAAGILLATMEDPAVACAGEGAIAGDRCRVAGRGSLTDAYIYLPMTSGDTTRLKLMESADATPFHTRKTGCTLVDALEVATGRADALIGTRLRPIEAMVAALFVKEAAGIACALDGNRRELGTDLVAGNSKIVNALLETLAK